MPPTSLWGGEGLCFWTPCPVAGLPEASAGGRLARVAIAKLGFASAKVDQDVGPQGKGCPVVVPFQTSPLIGLYFEP